MSDSGRPRARGRGRGLTGASGGGQQPLPPSHSGRDARPPQQSQGSSAAPKAWGPRPSAPTPQYSQAYQQRAPAPTTLGQAGRASMRMGDRPAEQATSAVAGMTLDTGNGGGGGRGSMRGGRQLNFESQTLFTRPIAGKVKQGRAGKPIQLISNYFELVDKPNFCLFEYRVDFNPEQDVTSNKRKMFGDAARGNNLPYYIFDGSNMYTLHKLHPENWEAFVTSPNDEPVQVTARLTREVGSNDIHILQLFNLIVRKCLSHMKLQLVGRNYFDPLAKIQISQYQLEIWPGYVTSIRQHESKVLMCVEIAHKVMRYENALGILKELSKTRQDYKKCYQLQIGGCVVLTDYNNRTYRIDDVDWSVSPQSTFKKSDGTSISYIDYYKQKYNLRIKEPLQPMLVSMAKPREIRAGMAEIIYLVPELCRLTGLTDRDRNNTTMMRALADHTRLAPDGRIQRLEMFSRRMKGNQKIVDELAKWDMNIGPKPITLTGRVLPPENIIQGLRAEVKYPVGSDADWTKNLRSNQMLSMGQINSWLVVCPYDLKQDAYSFIQMIIKVSKNMGLHLPQPSLQPIADDRAGTYLEGLNHAIAKKPSLIVCCASNNRIDRYSAIKKKCCVDDGIPTQVILRKSMIAKGAMSIATKVAIQINCKLGGAPWTVEFPLSGLMVIGFDVCHDTMSKSLSYGAMVASLDRHITRYYSSVSAHKNGEELSNDFGLNILKALRRYQEHNGGQVPDRIIIYRDGVGEGQLHYVYEHEVKCIETMLKDYYKEKPLRMAFVVVTKRINTRFFDGKNNPPPGTVVDDVVTMPQKYDFYLVSQCVRQGTVSPTNYNIIYDTLNLDPDKLQKLTYKLTHMYYNWSGTVRVPAPCQYAHKLAFLVSQCLHRDPNPKLDNLLYFL